MSRTMKNCANCCWSWIPTPIGCLSLKMKPTRYWRTGCWRIPNSKMMMRPNCCKNSTGFRCLRNLTGCWTRTIRMMNLSNLRTIATPKNSIRCSKKNMKMSGCLSLRTRIPIRCLSWRSRTTGCSKIPRNWIRCLKMMRPIANWCWRRTKSTDYLTKRRRRTGCSTNLTGLNLRRTRTANLNCNLRKPKPKNWTATNYNLSRN